jgi:malonate-semialdehyde dehydrogenase (acetylating)/methylmalonate-semialdehyde dehydrogenase
MCRSRSTLQFFSFTGWRSFYGDLHMYGKAGVAFYTQCKTIDCQLDRPLSRKLQGIPGLNR